MFMIHLQLILYGDRIQKRCHETDRWCHSKLPMSLIWILSDEATNYLEIEGHGRLLCHDGSSGEDEVEACDVEITSLQPKEDGAIIFLSHGFKSLVEIYG